MTSLNTDTPPAPLPELQGFLTAHRLPSAYGDLAYKWFLPLAEDLVRKQQDQAGPLVIGINGSQGSGKSTLGALLRQLFETRFGLRAVDLSIDDFYLPKSKRGELAARVHPLLATRGVPGTHDIPLMLATLAGLKTGNGSVAIPRFDKSRDDRIPETQWEQVQAPLDMIVLEGWCLGTPAQDEEALETPVNLLEANEDPDGRWRQFVNRQITEQYEPLYERIDQWIMLKAPSFDCVYQWRLEQEQKLADKVKNEASAKEVMDPQQLARFIEHYQRLTLHTLRTLPSRVDYLFELDRERNIRTASNPGSNATQ